MRDAVENNIPVQAARRAIITFGPLAALALIATSCAGSRVPHGSGRGTIGRKGRGFTKGSYKGK